MAWISNSAILNLAMLDSAHDSISSQSHSHLPRLVAHHLNKKNFTHSSLTQLDDGSHFEFCHVWFRHCNFGFRPLVIFLRFTQKHSHSTLTLTQTWFNLQLKLFHFHPNLMMVVILDSAIFVFPFKVGLTLAKIGSHHLHKNTSLIHSDSTWWWQPSCLPPCWIQTLPSWIQTPCYLLSDWHKNTLIPLWLWLKLNLIWLKLIHSHLTWWWQPSLIWPSCILPSYYFLSNSLTLAKIGSHHLHKKTSLIHSDSTWWWQPSWILSCWIKKLPSWILTYFYLLSDMTQKCSHSTLTPTQTNSIWLKLIHSHLTWWWQPFEFCHVEFWPSWIQPS